MQRDVGGFVHKRATICEHRVDPEEMGERIKSEVAKFGELMDKAKITAN